MNVLYNILACISTAQILVIDQFLVPGPGAVFFNFDCIGCHCTRSFRCDCAPGKRCLFGIIGIRSLRVSVFGIVFITSRIHDRLFVDLRNDGPVVCNFTGGRFAAGCRSKKQKCKSKSIKDCSFHSLDVLIKQSVHTTLILII